MTDPKEEIKEALEAAVWDANLRHVAVDSIYYSQLISALTLLDQCIVIRKDEVLDGLENDIKKLSHTGHRIQFLIKEYGTDADYKMFLNVVKAAKLLQEKK